MNLMGVGESSSGRLFICEFSAWKIATGAKSEADWDRFGFARLSHSHCSPISRLAPHLIRIPLCFLQVTRRSSSRWQAEDPSLCSALLLDGPAARGGIGGGGPRSLYNFITLMEATTQTGTGTRKRTRKTGHIIKAKKHTGVELFPIVRIKTH